MALFTKSMLDKCLPYNRASRFSAAIAAIFVLSGSLLAPPVQAEPDATEISFWESVKDTGNPEELKAYLNAYPEGAFAALARIRLNGLKQDIKKGASDQAQPSQPSKTGATSKTGEPAPHDCDLLAAHPWDPLKKASGVHLYAMNAEFAKGACEAALAVNPGTIRFQYQLGRAHEGLGDYEEAVKMFRQAAGKGHAAAMANLAIAYASARGVAKDDVQAVKWWRMAVENGFEGATTFLAQRYARGKGVTEDVGEASKLFRRGLAWHRETAAKGDAPAMHGIGVAYLFGRGVNEDKVEAVKWWRKAADKGFPAAMTTLGQAYANGWGVSEDRAEAVKWYLKAANVGNTDAMIRLGHAYAEGQGVTKDEAEAIKWYRKAAEAGITYAMKQLGSMYSQGRGVPNDPGEAIKWWRMAADKGNTDAMFDLGYAYAQGEGITKDKAKAVKWWQKAADKGHAQALTYLGIAYEIGAGVLEDRAEAVRLYRLAVANGIENGDAAMRLGMLGETVYDLAEIQQLLARAGFEPGSADGKMGRKTREAIKAYQRRVGLEADGKPSLALVKHLNKSASGTPSSVPSVRATTTAGGSSSPEGGLGDLNSLD